MGNVVMGLMALQTRFPLRVWCALVWSGSCEIKRFIGLPLFCAARCARCLPCLSPVPDPPAIEQQIDGMIAKLTLQQKARTYRRPGQHVHPC